MLRGLRRHIDWPGPSCLVACHDASGRRIDLVVALAGDRVVLSAPKGTTAVLTPLQAGALRGSIRNLLLELAA